MLKKKQKNPGGCLTHASANSPSSTFIEIFGMF